MVETIVIISLIGFGLFCFYCWAYSNGEKSVKTDLPKREEEFDKQKSSFLEESKRLEEKQKSQALDFARREATLNRRERSLNEREKQFNVKQFFLTNLEKKYFLHLYGLQKHMPTLMLKRQGGLKNGSPIKIIPLSLLLQKSKNLVSLDTRLF